jgi:Ca2+-transporting ATPase
MLTGDQLLTARNVAESVGLRPDAIHARVDPREKLELVAQAQARGEVVAMTGDGVNDAPALKKADIGIAMGKRGTEVARQASDMVLKDDSFASIVVAIEQGRVIYQNIRRFVVYLMSCNMSEIMIVGGAAMIDAPLPILPLQILFLNIVTDTFPALALGLGRGDAGIMASPARDLNEPILTRGQWRMIACYGALITLAVLGALAIALLVLDYSEGRAVTVSFLTLACAQLWHVFNMRQRGSGLLRNDVVRNPLVWASLVLCVLLIALAVYVPYFAAVLRMHDPGPVGWLLAFTMSLIPWAVGQAYNALPPRGRALGQARAQ